MKARVLRADIPRDKRIICVSDIHGSVAALRRLLEKVAYTRADALVLLGDLYTKGPQGPETLEHVIGLSRGPGVYVLRGNCDWVEPYMTREQRAWLDALPHVIETRDYVFVHGGIAPGELSVQRADACMKNDGFMEKGLRFPKYVVTGHWPTVNYTHEVPCANPIVDHAARIIAIDGGMRIKRAGQLNAFMIENGAYSFAAVDELPALRVPRDQAEIRGTLNITWLDRFVRLIRPGEVFGVYAHLATGRELSIAHADVYMDALGRACGSSISTDHYLGVRAGERVSLIADYGDRAYCKKDGIEGWVRL